MIITLMQAFDKCSQQTNKQNLQAQDNLYFKVSFHCQTKRVRLIGRLEVTEFLIPAIQLAINSSASCARKELHVKLRLMQVLHTSLCTRGSAAASSKAKRCALFGEGLKHCSKLLMRSSCGRGPNAQPNHMCLQAQKGSPFQLVTCRCACAQVYTQERAQERARCKCCLGLEKA